MDENFYAWKKLTDFVKLIGWPRFLWLVRGWILIQPFFLWRVRAAKIQIWSVQTGMLLAASPAIIWHK